MKERTERKQQTRTLKNKSKNDPEPVKTEEAEEDLSKESKRKPTIHELEERARQRKEKILEIKRKLY